MKINEKLLAIQKNVGKIVKDSENPFFKSKYFDVNSLLEHITPILNEQKIILTQPIKDGCVYSILTDIEDGETLESCLKIPEITDPQKIGSCITYYRRYTLQSLLALQAEDDDGNKASNKLEPKPKPDQTNEKPWINEKQFNEVCKRAETDKSVIDKAIDTYKIKKEWFAKLIELKKSNKEFEY